MSKLVGAGVMALALTAVACSSNPAGLPLADGAIATTTDAPCGEGTHDQNGVCVADGSDGGVTCGAGTHLQGSICVPDGPTEYEIRIVTSMIAADGHSGVPVLVIGTRPDGSPATDQVVLNTSRAGAGDFAPPAPTLGVFGATSYFTPCNATTPGCTGDVTLTVALASDPKTIVAHVDVELVTPVGVGNAAVCLTGGNVMYFNGNDYIYSGMLTVKQGTWSAAGAARNLSFNITPSGQSQGLWWTLEFNSNQLNADLTPGVYEMAERAAFASPGHPGMDIGGDGRGCNTITGRFQVEDFQRDPSGKVTQATVTFEQHCEGGQSVLNGCVHFAP